MENENNFIGDNIRKIREENGFTQAELANMTGIGEKHISAIERGKRGVGKQTRTKLCEAMGVDEQTLIYGKRETPHIPEHMRRLHEAIDKFVGDKSLSDQYLLASKILKIIQSDDGILR